MRFKIENNHKKCVLNRIIQQIFCYLNVNDVMLIKIIQYCEIKFMIRQKKLLYSDNNDEIQSQLIYLVKKKIVDKIRKGFAIMLSYINVKYQCDRW